MRFYSTSNPAQELGFAVELRQWVWNSMQEAIKLDERLYSTHYLI